MASIEIRSYHGAVPDAGTNVAGGELRFKQADNDTPDTISPVPIPPSGTSYSFVKNLRCYAASPPANAITNLRFYTDGSNGLGTGIGLRVKVEPGYTDPVALGTAQLAGTTDAFSATSGSPLAVPGGLSAPATGPFGDYVKLQATVTTAASQGTAASEVLTLQLDES